MPKDHSNLIVFHCRVKQVCQCHVHGRGHRVLLCRTIQLNPQNASRTLGDDFVHRAPPAVVGSRCGIAPLVRRLSISSSPKPSSLRTSSLCSPILGARLAGTFETPCTWIGLLTVEVSF